MQHRAFYKHKQLHEWPGSVIEKQQPIVYTSKKLKQLSEKD